MAYFYSGGHYTIYGYNLTDTVNLTNGSITGSVISGDDLILNIGTGSIRFVDASAVNVNGTLIDPNSTLGTNDDDTINNIEAKASINSYGGNDKIQNAGDNVLINSGEGNNYIENYGSDSTILTGNGNNTITTYDHSSALIISGDGNDYIENGWAGATVETGTGDDTIVNSGEMLLKSGAGDDIIIDDGVTGSALNGGTGNDTIYTNTKFSDINETFIDYTAGDGKDVIFGFDDKDTLTFDNLDFKTSYNKSGTIAFKVDGGSVTLKDLTATTFHINDEMYKISCSKFVKKS